MTIDLQQLPPRTRFTPEETDELWRLVDVADRGAISPRVRWDKSLLTTATANRTGAGERGEGSTSRDEDQELTIMINIPN